MKPASPSRKLDGSRKKLRPDQGAGMTTNNRPSIRDLAKAVLAKKWDSAWDKTGTRGENLSHADSPSGTSKIERPQEVKPFVPLSRHLGRGTLGQDQKTGTALGTRLGQAPVT